MELAIYIKNLLYNHDRVIISGLGSLQTVYKPAEINSSHLGINPPSKTILFDKTLSTSDGLLEKFISAQKKTTRKGAENLISDQINILNQKLDSEETIFWEGIGYFSKENGIIRFEPEQEANFLTDSFGLSKIDYKPVEFKLSPKQSIKISHPKEKKSYAYIFMFALIILLIGGGIATYLYYPDILNKFKKTTQKVTIVEPTKNSDTLVTSIKDSAKTNELEKVVDKSTDKKKALAINQAQNTPHVQQNVSYYIIAGSFKTFERASILAKQLKKQGYKPEVIQFDQELFRVSLGEFKDKPESLIQLDKIKTAKGAESVWLLTKKL